MRRTRLAAVIAVLLVGYSLYGGIALVGAALHGHLVTDDGPAVTPASAGPDAEPTPQEQSGPPFAFDSVAESRGLDYRYRSSYGGNHQLVTNAGVYVADYDRDGWDDVLAVGGARPVLYANQKGRFVASGALDGVERVRTALFLDHDRDGWQDLLLLRVGRPPLLLENDGGTFSRRDVGFRASLPNPVGATAGDYDGDGCPDLYVIQYGNWSTHLPAGHEDYDVADGNDNGHRNRLYWGDCGSFERADGASTPTRAARWSLATSTADLNGDGRPDIHVANDFNHDVVYLNRADGFRAVALGERTNRNGMSSELGDVNGDRRLDVFVTNIFYPDWAAERINAVLRIKASGNNLLVNRGDGTFAERSSGYGVRRGGWGWAAVMADFDNDGDEDLFHATRTMSFRLRDANFDREEVARLQRKPMYSRPVAWERRGERFDAVDAERAGFVVANGRGAASLDFDRDGALDLLVAAPGDQGYVLYENGNDRRALQVLVEANETLATGAEVFVRTDGDVQWRQVRLRTDFLAQDPGYLHFGVGDAAAVDVRVVWPDGTERLFRNVSTDRRVVLTPAGIERDWSLRSNRTAAAG